MPVPARAMLLDGAEPGLEPGAVRLQSSSSHPSCFAAPHPPTGIVSGGAWLRISEPGHGVLEAEPRLDHHPLLSVQHSARRRAGTPPSKLLEEMGPGSLHP